MRREPLPRPGLDDQHNVLNTYKGGARMELGCIQPSGCFAAVTGPERAFRRHPVTSRGLPTKTVRFLHPQPAQTHWEPLHHWLHGLTIASLLSAQEATGTDMGGPARRLVLQGLPGNCMRVLGERRQETRPRRFRGGEGAAAEKLG